MVDVHSATDEIRRGKKEEERRKKQDKNIMSASATQGSYNYSCAYHYAQLSYTIQHRTVLIIFPPILKTIVIAQMMSTGGHGGIWSIKELCLRSLAEHSEHHRT